MEILVLKPFVVENLSLFSGMLNDALMHCEGLEGYVLGKNASHFIFLH